MYGTANGNGRATLRLYQVRFPSKHMQKHKMFQLLHRQVCEKASFIASTDGRGRCTANTEKVTLDRVDETSGTSTKHVVYMLVQQLFRPAILNLQYYACGSPSLFKWPGHDPLLRKM
ncbi:hypothetical protein TNCV_2258341 [Trichonephila clavipes]|nr:hypothetical protein TNCV_2258341 [Trichonephila clavipes]